jgi:hypothetical protein
LSPIGKGRPTDFQQILLWGVWGALWNAGVRLVEVGLGWVFTLNGVALVDTKDDRWQSTFRGLALRSRVIVMDVSAAHRGLDYEAEFIADLDLVNRLILIQNVSSRVTSEQHVERLRSGRSRIPIVRYRTWNLRRLTADLHEAVKGLEAATS